MSDLIKEMSEVVQGMVWVDWQEFLRDRNPDRVAEPTEPSLVGEALEIAENCSAGAMSAGGIASTATPKRKRKKKTNIANAPFTG